MRGSRKFCQRCPTLTVFLFCFLYVDEWRGIERDMLRGERTHRNTTKMRPSSARHDDCSFVIFSGDPGQYYWLGTFVIFFRESWPVLLAWYLCDFFRGSWPVLQAWYLCDFFSGNPDQYYWLGTFVIFSGDPDQY